MNIEIEFTKMQGCGNDYVYIDGARFVIPMEENDQATINGVNTNL